MGLFSRLFGGDKAKPPKIIPKHEACVHWRENSYPMQVVGESNYQKELIAICGKHTRYGQDLELSAKIERESTNPFDSNAVAVKITGLIVGYLSQDQAIRVSEQMLADGIEAAYCNARVRGGWRTNQYDEGLYGVYLAIPNRGWIDFGVGSEPPNKSASGITRKPKERLEPSKDGPLVGEWVAIIGAENIGPLASELALNGANIMSGIGKTTTILVVNEEKPFSYGLTRSATYRKAIKLIESGSKMKIVSKSELHELIYPK
jgi:hypothetical protein